MQWFTNHSRVVTIVGLVLFVVIVIAPPLMYGYIYPNIGDDSAEHLNKIDEMIKMANLTIMRIIHWSLVQLQSLPLKLDIDQPPLADQTKR